MTLRTPHRASTLSAQPWPGVPFPLSPRAYSVGSRSSARTMHRSSTRTPSSGRTTSSRFTSTRDSRTWSSFRSTRSSRAMGAFFGSAGISPSPRTTTPPLKSSFRIRGRPQRSKTRPMRHHLTNVSSHHPRQLKWAKNHLAFYLILDLAAGGTSGWFPDKLGNKPWFDGSASAMRDFANQQSTWSATWPSDDDDLSFRMYVTCLCNSPLRCLTLPPLCVETLYACGSFVKLIAARADLTKDTTYQ